MEGWTGPHGEGPTAPGSETGAWFVLGHQTVLCFSRLLRLSVLQLVGGMAMQAEEEAQEGRPAAPGPVRIICKEPCAGHSVAQKDTPGCSCCRIDLIGKAAAQSRAKGSLARAGRTGREGNFSFSFFFFFFGIRFYFFNLIFILYRGIVDLQCCVSFRYTAKWFSYTYIYISILFQVLFPYRLLQNIE